MCVVHVWLEAGKAKSAKSVMGVLRSFCLALCHNAIKPEHVSRSKKVDNPITGFFIVISSPLEWTYSYSIIKFKLDPYLRSPGLSVGSKQ